MAILQLVNKFSKGEVILSMDFISGQKRASHLLYKGGLAPLESPAQVQPHHFPGEETEAQRHEELAQGHTAHRTGMLLLWFLLWHWAWRASPRGKSSRLRVRLASSHQALLTCPCCIKCYPRTTAAIWTSSRQQREAGQRHRPSS